MNVKTHYCHQQSYPYRFSELLWAIIRFIQIKQLIDGILSQYQNKLIENKQIYLF